MHRKSMFLLLMCFAATTILVAGCGDGAETPEEPKNPTPDAKSGPVVTPPVVTQPAHLLLLRATKPCTDDLSAMRKRRTIRVLVSYSRTHFYIAGGQPKGFECEMLLQYEKALNAGVPRDRHTDVVFVPVAFEKLLPLLEAGRGDIAASSLSVTSERMKRVAFTEPYLTNMDEIVIASPRVKGLKTLADLAGRKIYVMKSSSYEHNLGLLNKQLVGKGLKPVEIVNPGQGLETEDILEMVDAGILDLTVADRHISELWSAVLKNMVPRADLKVCIHSNIAWAVRKNNPELHASLSAFARKHKKGTLMGNILFKRYYQNTKWLRNPLTSAERRRLDSYGEILQRYGKQYDFDWLLLAAQAFQESRLDQACRSSAGAVGVMQVLPATARDMGFADISGVDNNIHAGVKYMKYLREKFFNDPALSVMAKVDFCLASYNAGPNRVQRWRKKAAQLGYDPNEWLDNVEHVALREIGSEPVRYVRNIHKYFVAYRLAYAIHVKKKKASSTANRKP
jgi:membrane-bound lytic murein transglycosylase MltF